MAWSKVRCAGPPSPTAGCMGAVGEGGPAHPDDTL